MTAEREKKPKNKKVIQIIPGGPYEVTGAIPLVRKFQVVTPHGEPVTWRKESTLETDKTYRLCRCGKSKTKPFCDDSHLENGFIGKETAVHLPTAERRVTIQSGKNIIVRRDCSLCMDSGFCGTRFANLEKMAPHSEDPHVFSQLIA